MRTYIVHASISENGTINGQPGDQTGTEVCRREIYNRDWHTVCRPKNSVVAADIVTQAEMAARNSAIGYSQGDRYSLYDYVNDTDVSYLDEVDRKVNCDCSSLVTTVLLMAGVVIPRETWTGSEVDAIRRTGDFQVIAYVDGMKLLAGDILIAYGHTAIVVAVESEEVTKPLKVAFATNFAGAMAGEYWPLTAVNVRAGAGTDQAIIRVADRQEPLRCYGYYSLDSRGVIWYLVQCPNKTIGFVSARVVSRISEVEE